jgi:hypothetical protein
MKAAYEGNTEDVLRLIKDKAPVNEPAPDATYLGQFPYNYSGTTALMAAARGNRIETAKILLEHGARVNAVAMYSATEATALMIAAQDGHIDLMKILLAHKADVNARSAWGQTALMRASENGHLEAVRLLVEHGADINAKFHGAYAAPPLPYPVTALTLAGTHKDVADFLTQHGASAPAPTPAPQDKRRSALTLEIIVGPLFFAIFFICVVTYVYPWRFESRLSHVLVHLPFSLLVLFPLFASLPVSGDNPIRIDLAVLPPLILVALICYVVKLIKMPPKHHNSAHSVSIKSVVLGFLANFLSSAVINATIGVVYPVILASDSVFLLSLVAGLVGTVFGGYIAGRDAKANHLLNALFVGVVNIVFGVFGVFGLFFFSHNKPIGFVVAGLILTIPAAMLGGKLSIRKEHGASIVAS